MNLRRSSKLMVEPPAVATGDIAFNLIVFFLVCASITPDTGRKQDIPRAEPKKEEKEQTKPTEVSLKGKVILLNGNVVPTAEFESRLVAAMKLKEASGRDVMQMADANRIVVVSTKDDRNTTYEQWVQVTGIIERVGGIVTLQLEEERPVEMD
jgi:biopolymer transport protein ExbD